MTTTSYAEDETIIHQHARKNAKEAIALARQRAAQFDTQAALERKTNEALALAKGQAHIRDDPEEVEGSSRSTKGAPLVDRKSDLLNQLPMSDEVTSRLGRIELPKPNLFERNADYRSTKNAYGSAKGIPTKRLELVGDVV